MIRNVARSFYHGDGQTESFFEGWYFKHRIGQTVLAVIPGLSISCSGRREGFVQCITNRRSHVVRFDASGFFADASNLYVRVGDNEFSDGGVRFSLDGLRGDIRYGPIERPKSSPYAPSMMGPFSYLPSLECYHDVVSCRHELFGYAELDGERVNFSGGAGYIEKDWGRSFPKRWVWLECSAFASGGAQIMAAVADVPFGGRSFTGVLCHLRLGEKTYRIATYHGSRVKRMENSCGRFVLELAQGGWLISAVVEKNLSAVLRAPVLGCMCRDIREYPACRLRLTVSRFGRTVYDEEGKNAGFECVGYD